MPKRDNLLAIYGDQMGMKEFGYLKVDEHGITSCTYQYGIQEGLFWMGLFPSPIVMIKEYRLARIQKNYLLWPISSHLVLVTMVQNLNPSQKTDLIHHP